MSHFSFYFQETNSLSNYQFLFQDLAITTLIGVTSKPFLKLSSQKFSPQIASFCPRGIGLSVKAGQQLQQKHPVTYS